MMGLHADELLNILKYYGNHPSLCFVSMGNEQIYLENNFLEKHSKKLAEKVSLGQKIDNRHHYTCATHPYTPGREVDDLYVTAWTDKFFDMYHSLEKQSKMLDKD
jgi:hypothetical protein